MNMVKTIFIYFLLLFMLCHHWHSHTDIRFNRIVKFKPSYTVMLPLTCFHLCCTLAVFSKQIQFKPLYRIRLSVIRFHLFSNNNCNYYTMTLTFNDIG